MTYLHKKHLKPNHITTEQYFENDDNLTSQVDSWRTDAINSLLVVSAIAFTPAIIVWGLSFNSFAKLQDASWLYLTIYILIVGMAIFRKLDYRIKAWTFLALTYITGTAALTLGGLAGDGRVYNCYS